MLFLKIQVDHKYFLFLFFKMLKQLKRICDEKCLKYFWLNHHNLLDDTKWDQAYHITMRLEKIIKEVELEPSKLAVYVCE